MLRLVTALPVLLLLLPGPLWAQRVLFEDRFRTEPEWRTERSRGRPREGAFEMESRLYDTHGFYDDSSRLHAYYRISVTTEYRGGPATSGYGLFFASPAERSSGENLEIRQDGMFRISDQPWQATDALRLGRGQVNTLTAENRAGEVTFLVSCFRFPNRRPAALTTLSCTGAC